MADIVKTKNVLNLVASFVDGDTRTISVDNPDTSKNLKGLINALGTECKSSQVILGDKTGAAFDRFTEGKILRGQTTYLDLTTN